MVDYLIHFDRMPWETPKAGVTQKIYSDGRQRLRLLRFEDHFVEADWCTNGHLGLVLAGEMKIDFNEFIKHYQKGDGIWIPEGVDSKHKVIMEPGKSVELILFESEHN